MLKSMEISGFRGMKSLRVENLAPVTLFTGDNGAGKTTMLEATLALYGRLNPAWVMNLQTHRGFAAIKPSGPNYSGLFYEFRDVGKATVTGEFSGGKTWKVVLERASSAVHSVAAGRGGSSTSLDTDSSDLICKAYRGQKIFHTSALVWEPGLDGKNVRLTIRNPGKLPENAILMHPADVAAGKEEAERFGDAKEAGRSENIIESLRAIDPRISDVEYLITSAGDYFSVGRNGQRAPLGMKGGGMNNLFRFLVNLDYARGGFLGIDEIENGFHHSRLARIFSCLISSSLATGTQLMMSTHSAEAIAAFVAAADSVGPNDLAVVHLSRQEDESVVAKTFRGRDAISSVKLGYELR